MSAPPTADDVLIVIQRIAEAELSQKTPILSHHQLVTDLAMDSLASMILAVGLEDHYRIRLDEHDAATLKTVADVIALVQRRVSEC